MFLWILLDPHQIHCIFLKIPCIPLLSLALDCDSHAQLFWWKKQKIIDMIIRERKKQGEVNTWSTVQSKVQLKKEYIYYTGSWLSCCCGIHTDGCFWCKEMEVHWKKLKKEFPAIHFKLLNDDQKVASPETYNFSFWRHPLFLELKHTQPIYW